MSAGRLVRKSDGTEVVIGTILKAPDGTQFVLQGWRRPQKASSSGRVFVKKRSDTFERHLFPHVFDLKIVDHDFSDQPEPTVVEDEHGNIIGENFGPIT